MNASTYGGEGDMSARKRDIRRLADARAPERRKWLARAAFFHEEDLRYLKFLIPEGARVLELGCGTGDLLAALKPSFGVGVDFSAGMIVQGFVHRCHGCKKAPTIKGRGKLSRADQRYNSALSALQTQGRTLLKWRRRRPGTCSSTPKICLLKPWRPLAQRQQAQEGFGRVRPKLAGERHKLHRRGGES